MILLVSLSHACAVVILSGLSVICYNVSLRPVIDHEQVKLLSFATLHAATAIFPAQKYTSDNELNRISWIW